jgi:hypothetical protein
MKIAGQRIRRVSAKKLHFTGSLQSKKKVDHSAGFGTWKDREDMKDVATYVRKIRGSLAF